MRQVPGEGPPEIDVASVIQRFQEFFKAEYNDYIFEAFRKGNAFIVIDFSKLAMHDPDVADQLLREPEETLKAAEVAMEYFDIPESIKLMSVRVDNLPGRLSGDTIRINELRDTHLDTFKAINGLVRRM